MTGAAVNTLSADYGNAMLHHGNSEYLLLELLNGTQTWLCGVLRRLQGVAGTEPDSETVRCLLTDYTKRLYNHRRAYNSTAQSLHEFLHANPDTAAVVLSYFLHTLITRYDDRYIYAFNAVDIALHKHDRDFDAFLKGSGMDLDAALHFYALFVMPGKETG
jgi:hypothetical protein